MEVKHSNQRDFSPPGASKPDEKALVAGLKRKDNQAYRLLIENWGGKLFQLAFRFVRNEEEAQEILQEVLQKIVEKIDTFKGDSSLYTWLYRITVNQSLMRLRKNEGKKMISWEEILPHYENGIMIQEIPDWAQLPDKKFAEKEMQQFIKECIDELPNDIKAAYILKDVEQQSENDVCRTLEITKPAMKNRVHRGRLFIRKKLEERLFKKEKV